MENIRVLTLTKCQQTPQGIIEKVSGLWLSSLLSLLEPQIGHFNILLLLQGILGRTFLFSKQNTRQLVANKKRRLIALRQMDHILWFALFSSSKWSFYFINIPKRLQSKPLVKTIDGYNMESDWVCFCLQIGKWLQTYASISECTAASEFPRTPIILESFTLIIQEINLRLRGIFSK